LQTLLLPHCVPDAAGVSFGTPLSQLATSQVEPFVGTSASSGIDVTLPMPSHTAVWQSPGVCCVSGVFAAV
jgi:hypothetical protein